MSDENLSVAMQELQELQSKLQALAQEIAEEENGEVIMEKALEAQKLAAELQEKGEAIGEKLAARQGDLPKTTGDITIELTPWQRARIKEETDLDMETIVLQDKPLFFNEIIPTLDPDTVEVWAVREAHSVKERIEAEAKAKAEFHAMLRELEANDNPDFQEELARQKQDPKGLGGLIALYGEPE